MADETCHQYLGLGRPCRIVRYAAALLTQGIQTVQQVSRVLVPQADILYFDGYLPGNHKMVPIHELFLCRQHVIGLDAPETDIGYHHRYRLLQFTDDRHQDLQLDQ